MGKQLHFLKDMKSILICCSLLLAAGCVSGQHLSIGTHLGFGASAHQRIFEKDYGRYFSLRPVTSFAHTLDINWHFNRRITLVSGVGLETKGVERYGSRNRYFYMTVPVALRWAIIQHDSRPWAWYIQGGFYGASAVGHTQKYAGYGGYADIYLPEYQNILDTDWGWTAATGILFRVNRRIELDFQTHFSHGLKDLYRENQEKEYRLANVALQCRLGAAYHF